MEDDLGKYSLSFLFSDDSKCVMSSIAIRCMDMRWITSKSDEIQENDHSWDHRRDGKKHRLGTTEFVGDIKKKPREI